MNRNIPKVFLGGIISWHDGLTCRVCWDNFYSKWFQISAGARQGGVLSPDFYSIYVDDLIDILRDAGIGCYIQSIFAAAIFYADDMAVLSPSVKGLQKLLNICQEYCSNWDILLNAKKTKNMCFGRGSTPCFTTTINNVSIPWVSHWKYLGVTLQAGPTFQCCIKDKLSSFYRALNSILRIEGNADEMVKLRLLESHCLPILTFEIEVIHVPNHNTRRQLRVAYNSIFRNLFQYTYRESVTDLQHSLGRKTWEELLELRKLKFSRSCASCTDSSLVRVAGSIPRSD